MVAPHTAAVQRLEMAVDDLYRASPRDSLGYEDGPRLFERLAAAAPTPGSYADGLRPQWISCEPRRRAWATQRHTSRALERHPRGPAP